MTLFLFFWQIKKLHISAVTGNTDFLELCDTQKRAHEGYVCTAY